MEWPKITKETPLEEIKRIHQAIYIVYGLEKKDPEKKADLARQIRDLPFKYELES